MHVRAGGEIALAVAAQDVERGAGYEVDVRVERDFVGAVAFVADGWPFRGGVVGRWCAGSDFDFGEEVKREAYLIEVVCLAFDYMFYEV
jgi:hypothetical protein